MKKAFTMIELIFIIVILGILAKIAVTQFNNISAQNSAKTLKTAIDGMNSQNSAAILNKIMLGESDISLNPNFGSIHVELNKSTATVNGWSTDSNSLDLKSAKLYDFKTCYASMKDKISYPDNTGLRTSLCAKDKLNNPIETSTKVMFFRYRFSPKCKIAFLYVANSALLVPYGVNADCPFKKAIMKTYALGSQVPNNQANFLGTDVPPTALTH